MLIRIWSDVNTYIVDDGHSTTIYNYKQINSMYLGLIHFISNVMNFDLILLVAFYFFLLYNFTNFLFYFEI